MTAEMLSRWEDVVAKAAINCGLNLPGTRENLKALRQEIADAAGKLNQRPTGD